MRPNDRRLLRIASLQRRLFERVPVVRQGDPCSPAMYHMARDELARMRRAKPDAYDMAHLDEMAKMITLFELKPAHRSGKNGTPGLN